uniref:DUF6884 domain-containing protein n=1 Tax=Halobacterium sp. (strain GN101) TaxID=88773 RepID=UPI00350E3E7B
MLSAKYHVLNPDGSPIEPYDKTLNNASVEERREWGQDVFKQLRERDLLAEGEHARHSCWEVVQLENSEKPTRIRRTTAFIVI